jgi:PAS domain S-box-containing protein
MVSETKPEYGALTEAAREDRFRILVDAITDYAIYMLDADGHVTSWNRGAERFKGYSEEEILGSHFSRFYTPDDRASELPKRALQVAADTGRFENEGWRVRKDGTRFWAHVIVDAIRDTDGKLIGYAKITRDLTERKKAEAQLRLSEEQFRRLVQGVTDYAIYMLDKNGYVTNWNAGAERIKGYRPEEIIGQHFSRFYTAEDQANGAPAIALETAAREGRFEKEALRVRKDGSRFIAHVVIDTILDDDGEVIGFAKITRDVTERVEAQRALDQAKEDLFQAQKMEAVGQLTGGIAHDFNNLLMAILGSLEILRKRVGDNEALLPLIDNAMRGAERGAALTKRMLAFSRRQELRYEPVDVLELVRGMAGLLQTSLGSSISIETHFPFSLPPVLSDAHQLASALLNLAVNARDAISGGGVVIIAARMRRIDEGAIPDLKPGSYVCLSVQDDGEGMDEETLNKATTPFFTTKGIGKGTGLGLPMVHGLMAQSGGKLILRSAKGVGTTAELYLPLAEAVQEPSQEQSLPSETTTTAASRVAEQCLKVLAVDDDPLVLMNTALMLQDLCHEALTAHSGVEALAKLEQVGSVDLVITDHAMPQMTGAQLAESVQQRWPEIPVLIATGYAELPPGVADRFSRLSKPFTQSELAEAIALAVPSNFS